MNPTLLIVGAAALAYFWYENQNKSASGQSCTPSGSSNPLTAASVTAAAAQAGLTVGQMMTLAQQSGETSVVQCIQALFPGVAAQALPAAVQNLPASAPSSPASGAPSSPITAIPTPLPSTQTTTTSGITTSGQPVPGSLAAIFQAMVNYASEDQQFTYQNGDWYGTPYHWNFYLSYVDPTSPVSGMQWPPDVATVFPGVDLTQPMSSLTYWAAMSPWLQAKYGLSGLSGAPAHFASARFSNYGGWAA